MADYLSMWTIYNHPDDFPNAYVVREWRVHAGFDPQPAPAVHLADDLLGARSLVPAGLVRMDRQPNDQQHIVETWF